MAHAPKPFFRTARNAWYVQLGKQQIKLGDGPKNSNTEKAAWSKFHEVMNERGKPAPAKSAISATAGPFLGELFEKYLEWCQRHREKRTYDGYVWHIQAFCNHIKVAKEMSALDLKPFHVIEWLDAHPGWGQTYRRNATAAIQRAFNWAEELGYVASNPIRKIKKPMPKRREHFITPEAWVSIRGCYKDGDPFREFLEFCWETGARPHEARTIEAKHVHLDRAVIAIPPEEAKGRKRWRVIRLEGRALEIVAKRLPNAKAKLFVNRRGKPWTSFSINCRFCRLKLKLGVKHFAYAFRHGFANRMLVSGADYLTVAALLGHSDGTMLAKVYQHLDQSDAHLREALKKANGESVASA